jgi:arginase
MHLVDGAEAIAGDLPRASTARVEVPASAGEALDTGIRRFSALSRTAAALRSARRTRGPTGDGDGDENFLVIGGDCGVAVPAIAHAAARRGALDDSLAVVWFDAHGDLNTRMPRLRARSPAWRCAR